ncbi:MAG TPA: methyltransferase domain-containing protein [Solirubrobacteraceae bacterium]|nr:methyltransferase domain-containing protein [Solirubrobacteraceae bacterium]
MSRLVDAVRVRAATARHRGGVVQCPLCEHGFDRFKDEWNRASALCWRCGSHERHRAQWLLLDRHRPELLEDTRALLHFSPEWCLRDRLASLSHLRYVTTDLDPAQDVELRVDVTATGLPDGAFDAVICSHVLEHVPDDAAAMGELRRMTAPGGWCLVMVPLALDRTTTYEDASIATPEDRAREFLQHDHVRLYAPDIADRLRAAGFDVEVVDLTRELGPERAARHGLLASDLIFLCRPA